MRLIDGEALLEKAKHFREPELFRYWVNDAPTIEPKILDDGTLVVKVKDGSKVGRVLVEGENHFSGLYYAETEPKQGEYKNSSLYSLTAEVQNILDFLDAELHPIVSPDHWNVYSELHDMISLLSPADRPQDRYWHEDFEGIAYGKVKTEPQTELVNDSQILVKDLVDDEFNPYDEECMRCKHLKLKCEFIPTYCKFESRDEPQTDCDRYVIANDEGERVYNCIGCQMDCAWR